MKLTELFMKYRCKLFGHQYTQIGNSEREVEELDNKYQKVALYAKRRCLRCGDLKIEKPVYILREKPRGCMCIKEVWNFKENRYYKVVKIDEYNKIYVVKDDFGYEFELTEKLFNYCFEFLKEA